MISSAKKYPEQAQASNRILAGTSIGENGRVEGEVECKNAAIAGQLEGTLNVAQTLSLSASAKVKGKVQVEKLAVEPGAEINGSVSMGALMKKVGEADSTATKTA